MLMGIVIMSLLIISGGISLEMMMRFRRILRIGYSMGLLHLKIGGVKVLSSIDN